MKIKITILLLIFLLTKVSSGQDDYELLNYVELLDAKIYITNEDNILPEKIISPFFLNNFQEIPENYVARPDEAYWFLIDFNGKELPEDVSLYLQFPYYDIITLYYNRYDSLLIKQAGLRNKLAEDVHDFSDISFETSYLIDDRYLFVRVKDYTNLNRIQDVMLQSEFSLGFFDNYQSRSSERREIPYYLFTGGMALIISFFIGYFFLYRDSLFIIYSLYLFALLLYLGSKAGFAQDFLRSHLTAYIYFYNNIIQVVVNIFYLMFSIAFLNAKKDYPRLLVFIRYTIYFLVLIVLFLTLAYVINPFSGIEETVLNIERYYMILFSLVAYVHILMSFKNKLAVFFVGGSFIFLTGAVLALFFRNIEFMMYGAAIEVFIFSLGMGYKTKQIETEKKRIEGEMDRVKLTALKAQMNPHFIFNSLNSIRAYVISNKVKKASDYLSKFAQLMRLMLNYSSKEHIELYDELEALKLYVQLEELRFRKDFGFSINRDSDIDLHELLIPPLILQPYLENAIRHGLAPRKGCCKLVLALSLEQDQINFSIRDNGVGRIYSKSIKTVSDSKHKSMAMELTRSRINLMGRNSPGKDQVQVIDHFEGGKPSGTEVIIRLPLKRRKNEA